MIKKFAQVLLLALAGLSLNAVAATAPSPAMMAQFQKLPKAEQQRLMRQYGITPGQLRAAKSRPAQDETEESELSELDFAEPLNEPEQAGADKEPQRFGLNLFKSKSGFNDSENGAPVPENYVLGSGDELLLQVFGKQSFSEQLVIGRDGTVIIPELGPVIVAGLTFSEAKAVLTDRVKKQILGVEVAVSMGELKTISIFIAGEAKNPGSYTVPGLSTITQALVAAGGVSDIGSLRDISVKRAGKLVVKFDAYDLLLAGDASNDVALQHGDVIFVAPVKALAEVAGEVHRPAVYEVNSGETIGQLLAMAGGAKATGYPQNAILERVNSESLRNLLNLDLTTADAKSEPVRAGDLLRIGSTSPRFENVVTIAGAVVRPGKYAWRNGIRVSDLLSSLWADLHLSVDLDYALIVREVNSSGQLKVLHFNLGEAINNKASVHDLKLQSRDQLFVFHHDNTSYQREVLNTQLMDLYLKRLNTQKLLSEKDNKNVETAQNQNAEQSPELDNLMDQGFSLIMDKKTGIAVEKPTAMQQWLMSQVSELILTSLNSADSLTKTQHFNRKELMFIILEKLKSRNNFITGSQTVTVYGEVKVQGEYPLTENATVKSLIESAGGLKDSAFMERAELTSAVVDDVSGDVQVKHSNIKLNDAITQPDLYKVQGRDRLNVFSVPNWNIDRQVTLSGLVRFPGTYSIQQGEKLSDLLRRAGGLKPDAFAQGAIFTRKQTREREIEQIKKLSQQLKADIVSRTLTAESAGIAPQEALTMIAEIEKVKPIGRLVVDIEKISEGKSEFDFLAEDGDELFVPPANSSISVLGEVQHASSHRFSEGTTVEDYLKLAGGLRKRADAERVYIIRANGSVFIPDNNSWFAVDEQRLEPGDTIVVPLDTEYKESLTLWTEITQIFYQSAVALAAVNSF